MGFFFLFTEAAAGDFRLFKTIWRTDNLGMRTNEKMSPFVLSSKYKDNIN